MEDGLERSFVDDRLTLVSKTGPVCSNLVV